MEGRSQRTPALVAAAASVVLVLSMFLDWYKLDLPERIAGRDLDIPTFTAFEGLERSDVALVVAALVALALAVLLVARVLASSPAPGLGLLAAGLFALAVVAYRGANRPTRALFGDDVDTTLQFGWYLALLAAASVAVTGLLAYLAGPRLELEVDEYGEDEGLGAETHQEST